MGGGWRMQYLIMQEVAAGRLRPDLSSLLSASDSTNLYRHPQPSLLRLIKRCWAQEPAMRPSALDVARKLQELMMIHRTEQQQQQQRGGGGRRLSNPSSS